MEGFYPSTYGFENDTNGADPSYWDVSGAGVQILQHVGGHEKVLDLHQAAQNYKVTNHFGEIDNGTIEFYIRYVNIDFEANIRLLAENSTPLFMFGIDNDRFYYWDGSWNDLGIFALGNRWYHMRIDFECTTNNYQNLAQWKWHIIIDGFEYGDYSFASNLKPGKLEFGGWGHYPTYIDAVGYSWDPFYKIGDNIKGGLLVSFTSIVNPSWTRYSLDGLPNRTIWGNITIEMPSYGPHSIQIFAFNTTLYSSEIRYFTVDWTLTQVLPIFIDDSDINYNWFKKASENDWCSGSGTIVDPYIIEYVWIDGSGLLGYESCVTIQKSNVSFIIRNSIFNHRYIHLDNVKNGKIQQNDFPYPNGEVWLDDSSNNEILDNFFGGIGSKAISLYGSSYNKVARNILNGRSIEMGGGAYNHFSENVIENAIRGFFISGNYQNTTLWKNTINNCHEGIGLQMSSHLTISENIITNCDSDGIAIYSVTNCDFIDNYFANCTRGFVIGGGSVNNSLTLNKIRNKYTYGLICETGSENNTIYNNKFIGVPAYDNGANNVWNNSIIGNYWDDYKGYDLNGDFIGDNPYNIPGLAGSLDYLPIWNWTGNDNVEPKITVNLPQPFNISRYNPPSFNINIEEYSLEDVWYTLNNSLAKVFVIDNGTIDPSYWDTIGHGLIPLTFFAIDTSGNIGSVEVLIYKDILAPKITILGPHPDYWQIYLEDTYPSYWYSNPPTFLLYISEQTVRTWYTLDGGMHNVTFTGLEGTINQDIWTSTPNEWITITFYAEDLVGNIGSAEVMIHKLFDISQYYPIIILGVVGVSSVLISSIVLIRRRRRRKKRQK
jgi:parallel beta-helix repeat protein